MVTSSYLFIVIFLWERLAMLCQLMGLSTVWANRHICGVVKEDTLFSAIVILNGCEKQPSYRTDQLWYSKALRQPWGQVALGPGPSPTGLLCSAQWSALSLLFCSILASLLWPALARHFGVSVRAGKSSLRSGWKGECASRARGELTYVDRNPCPWYLTGLSSYKWRLQILAVWLVQRYCPGWWEQSLSG